MKHLLAVLSFILIIIASTAAQDLIIKNNGDTLKCIIIEEGVDMIKCVDYRNPDGQVYRILARDVQKIEYSDGEESSYEERRPDGYLHRDEPLSIGKGFWGATVSLGMRKLDSKAIRHLYGPYREPMFHYNRGKKMVVAGNIIGMTGAFMLGWSVGKSIGGGEINNTTIAIGAIGVIGGLTMLLLGNNEIRHSVSLYNSAISKTSAMKLGIGPTRHGVGLSLIF